MLEHTTPGGARQHYSNMDILQQLAQDELISNDACSAMGGPLNLFDFDFTDPVTPCDQYEESFLPPSNAKATNLKQLVNFIHGDIYHCAICSSKFEEPTNLPRVLFCGDCLCERCIRSSIQPKAITDGKNREAAGQLTCLVCGQVHVFKMTRGGFIVSNERFVKIRDEHGLVNLLGSRTKYREDDLRRAIEQRQMMDNSILVPEDLIIRSLPLNVELIELIRERQEGISGSGAPSKVIENIGKFIHLDQLDEKEAKYYMQELCKICDEEIQQ